MTQNQTQIGQKAQSAFAQIVRDVVTRNQPTISASAAWRLGEPAGASLRRNRLRIGRLRPYRSRNEDDEHEAARKALDAHAPRPCGDRDRFVTMEMTAGSGSMIGTASS